MKNGKRRNIDTRTRAAAAAPPPDPRDAEIASLRNACQMGAEAIQERDRKIRASEESINGLRASLSRQKLVVEALEQRPPWLVVVALLAIAGVGGFGLALLAGVAS